MVAFILVAFALKGPWMTSFLKSRNCCELAPINTLLKCFPFDGLVQAGSPSLLSSLCRLLWKIRKWGVCAGADKSWQVYFSSLRLWLLSLVLVCICFAPSPATQTKEEERAMAKMGEKEGLAWHIGWFKRNRTIMKARYSHGRVERR